jgi:hypothetical protein
MRRKTAVVQDTSLTMEWLQVQQDVSSGKRKEKRKVLLVEEAGRPGGNEHIMKDRNSAPLGSNRVSNLAQAW